MNIFFVMGDGTLVTPPLGTILPGITRASLITIARDAGMSVEEQPYSFDQWQDDTAHGRPHHGQARQRRRHPPLRRRRTRVEGD